MRLSRNNVAIVVPYDTFDKSTISRGEREIQSSRRRTEEIAQALFALRVFLSFYDRRSVQPEEVKRWSATGCCGAAVGEVIPTEGHPSFARARLSAAAAAFFFLHTP